MGTLDQLADLLAEIDLLPVDSYDYIPRLHRCGRRGRVLGEAGDLHARHPGQTGQQDDHHHRTDDIHRRPGGDDRHALPGRLGGEESVRRYLRLCWLFYLLLLRALLGPGSRFFIAGHAHEAAHREDAQRVFGLPAPPAEESRPEADGELMDPNADPFGHQEVSSLVDEDQKADRDKKSNNRL